MVVRVERLETQPIPTGRLGRSDRKRMVLSGVRALIARQISRIRIGRGRSRTSPGRGHGPGQSAVIPTPPAPQPQPEDHHHRAVSPPPPHPHLVPSVVEVAPSIMVYTYTAPFETGSLKVSDIHTLQSVVSSHSHPRFDPFSRVACFCVDG